MQLARSAIGQLLLKPGASVQPQAWPIAVRCRSPKPRFVQHRAASFLAPASDSLYSYRNGNPFTMIFGELGEKCEFGA